MTSLNKFAPIYDEPTTAVPSLSNMCDVLPELSSPQERYDHGFQRGYTAGYAEGARQAQAEKAADLATQKAAWAQTMSKASALVSQLATATEEYLTRFGPRDLELTEALVRAAFELAEAVVGSELRTRPELPLEIARKILAELPAGPATVRVNPSDQALLDEAAAGLGKSRAEVAIVADPAVGPGGCIVTSAAKTVDARVEQALVRAREAFCSERPEMS